MPPKVSIITAAYQVDDHLEACLRSVMTQSHRPLEHILVVRESTPRLESLLQRHSNWFHKVISESDSGLYDALNAGISECTGDIIGLLHSNDRYTDSRVVETVVTTMTRENTQACYGDLVYESPGAPGRCLRFWKSGPFCDRRFYQGWMPPHPTFFARRELYQSLGTYRTDFAICADYELLLRFLLGTGRTVSYVPRVLVYMQTGGLSGGGLHNQFLKCREDYRAWKVNGLSGALPAVLLKKLSKIPQFLRRPPLTNDTVEE